MAYSIALRLLVALATLPIVFEMSHAKSRQWTSDGGKFSVDAELVDYTDKSVRLKIASGKQKAVPLDRLSQKDVAYLRANKDNYYLVEDLFRIKNPARGVGWKIHVRQKHGDFEVLALVTHRSLDDAGFAITIVRQPIDPNLNEKQREGVAMLYSQELLTGFGQTFEVKKGQIETRKKKQGKLAYGARAMLLANNGLQIGLLTEAVFRGDVVYHVQVMFLRSSPLTGAELLKVGETIEPLAKPSSGG